MTIRVNQSTSKRPPLHRFVVPLGTLGTGRLGLKPGRSGRILPVFDDELASIIAYSLSSEEYCLKVRSVCLLI